MKKSSRILRNTLLVVSVVLAAVPAHAGFGDALKQRALKAVKGEKKPVAAASADAGPIASRIKPPVTAENIAKFKAGMQYELSEREKTKKFLATVKTLEAYNKCKTDWMMSAEGQKFSKEYMDAVGSVKTSEEMQKVAGTYGPRIEKKIEEVCGGDPATFNENWKAQQAREALGHASDDFAKDQGLEAGTEDYAYSSWKEWIAEFCHYIEKLKKEPDAQQKLAKIMDEGLRIPGYGTGIYFVYTASEAKQLLENCDSLMPLITATM